jgi:hypothetical protein
MSSNEPRYFVETFRPALCSVNFLRKSDVEPIYNLRSTELLKIYT